MFQTVTYMSLYVVGHGDVLRDLWVRGEKSSPGLVRAVGAGD